MICKFLSSMILLISSPSLFAHTNEFNVYNVVAHQVFSFEHLLSLLAIGVISSKHKNFGSYLLPVIYFLALVVGYGISIDGATIETVQKIFSLSVLFLGVLFFTEKTTSEKILPIVFLSFSMTHGIAHGQIQLMDYSLDNSAIFYQASFFSYLSLIALLILAAVGHGALKYIKGQMAFGYVLAFCCSVFLLQS